MWTFRRALAVCAAVAVIGMTGDAASVRAQPSTGSVLPADVGVDESIGFESRGLSFQGSLRIPSHPVVGAAALLIPGSGPTDRNGNQPGLAGETMRRTADLLAAQGITSYRFDKFGSGETGLAGLPIEQVADYGYEDQLDDAAAAAALLSERTGVAAENVLVVGHSEGGLTALVLSTRGLAGGGVALLEPLPMRYLDLLSAQLAVLFNGPGVPAEDRDRLSADAGRALAALRDSGTIPDDLSPELRQVGLAPANARFLAEADRYDPVALAGEFPAALPTLLTCSDKDLNVSCEQLDGLRAALAHTDLDNARFATASHTLGELGPLPPRVVDPTTPLPISGEYLATMSAWAGGRAG